MTPEAIEQQVSLATIESVDPKLVFTGGGIEVLKTELSARLAEHEPDTETAQGRKDIASFAYKFAREKTLVDGIGKRSVEALRKDVKAIDAICKDWRGHCDSLRDAARKPLDNWEAAQERIQAEEVARREKEAAELKKGQDELDAYDADELRTHRLEQEQRRVDEMYAAEVEAQKARDAKIAAEAAEKARRDAEQAAEQAKADAEAAIQAEKDRAAKAEADKVAAAKQAEIDKANAVAETEAQAKRNADKVENDRIFKERADKAEKDRKASNVRHRNHVMNEAINTLVCPKITRSLAGEIITAIMENKIKHVTLNF